jgi:isocitrate dehydrogenase kinase/phosphatase
MFYRNTGAYVVGRLRCGERTLPLVVAFRATDAGVAADAVLTSSDEASVVFGFAWSYFHVDAPRPSATVAFLHAIMPNKRIDELYTAIGYNKHGKTELYRALAHHLEASEARFEEAEGTKGLVMSVFTLPSFNIVLKIIKDRIAAPKRTTRRQVMEQYHRVFVRDRVGRLADAQLFQGLEFRRSCFSAPLLAGLLDDAPSAVRVEGDRVVLGHLYTERRLRPLNLYLQEVDDAAAEAAIVDYGRAIKDLAATNIFTGDLLLKNFGVSRHGRVIFYDYDELALLTECTFRELPQATLPEDELSAEPWFAVGEHDIFPEEFVPFLLPPGRLREVFLDHHGDLLDPRWWRGVQARQRAGELVDTFPYPAERRLRAGGAG